MSLYSFYFGFDVRKIKNKISHSSQNIQENSKTDFDVTNYESRVGYTVGLGSILITPLVTFGYHKQESNADDIGYNYKWYYKGYGSKILLLLSPKYQIGFDFKLLEPVNPNISVKSPSLWNKDTWPSLKMKNKIQYDLEVPFYIFYAPFDLGFAFIYRQNILKNTSNQNIFKADIKNSMMGIRLNIGLKI